MKRLAVLALAVAPFGAACDSGPIGDLAGGPSVGAPPADFASGSRLRARYHLVDGVVAVFATFHDRELGTDCAYEDESGVHAGPDATSYCLPSDMAHHREALGPFVDDACDSRAAFAPAASAAKYAVVDPRESCATAPTFFAALPPETRTVYLKDPNGVCVFQGTKTVQRLGDPLPAGTFVRAFEEIETRPGRLDARILVGADGSRRVVGGFDRSRGEASRVALADDGTKRWLPSRVAFVGGSQDMFEEATCGKSVATKIARTATCPVAAVAVLHGTCGAASYLTVGDRVSSAFFRDESACVPAGTRDVLAFRLGTPIEPSAYAAVVELDIGSRRVRRRGLGAADGSPIVWSEVIDATTSEPCEVFPTLEGTLRCLPAAAAPVSVFADAACVQPAFAQPITGCETGPPPRYVRDVLDSPPRTFEVLGELSTIYALSAGRCALVTPTVPSRSFAVKEIAPANFPPASLVSE